MGTGISFGSPTDLSDSTVMVKVYPHVDLDTVITWTTGKPTQIVVTGLSKTKTMVLSWTGDNLDSIATVIT